MVAHINLENTENQHHIINEFFKKNYKVIYKKKLTGNIRLYISEKNSIKHITNMMMLYKRDLQ